MQALLGRVKRDRGLVGGQGGREVLWKFEFSVTLK